MLIVNYNNTAFFWIFDLGAYIDLVCLFAREYRWNSWNFFACNINETVIKETGAFFLPPTT